MPAATTDLFDRVSDSATTRPVVASLAAPGKAIGAASINLADATGWTVESKIHFTIYNTVTINGVAVKDPSTQTDWQGTLIGTTISNLTLTGGIDRAYVTGAIVELTLTAKAMKDLYDGLAVAHNPTGTLKGDAVRTALGVTSSASDGWDLLTTTPTVSSGSNKGNKETDLLFSNVDLSTTLTPGMRFKCTRATTPPTACIDLESSSSQYFSRTSASVTGITFTDDFTCEAWVKLESYPTAAGMVVSRLNAAASQGWYFQILSSGQVRITGVNTTDRQFSTYQSVPLNQWVHIAATLDMSGATGTMYINGTLVPSLTTGAQTALVQGGDLQIGNFTSATQYFDGKIADVRVWSTVRTATQIRDNMNQQLVGNETGLVGYWQCDEASGTTLTDSTANANTLTGAGGATAGSADNPMKATEYAVITKVSYSSPNTTVTVFTGTDYNIPNQTLSQPYYSREKVPYGFPASRGKWTVSSINRTNASQSTPTINVWYNIGSTQLSVPSGEWIIDYSGAAFPSDNSSNVSQFTTLSTGAATEDDKDMTHRTYVASNTVTAFGLIAAVSRSKSITLTSATTYYMNHKTDLAGADSLNNVGADAPSLVKAECAYI